MSTSPENPASAEKWLSMNEMKEHLGASRESIVQWVNNKNMPAHKLGRMWRFKISEVDEWILQGEAATRDE